MCKFYETRSGVISASGEDTFKPQLLTGFGEINFGKQFRQGNRVYSSDHIAMALNAQPVGNMGGNSYLYVVKDEDKEAYILDDLYANRELRLYEECPTLRSERSGLKVIEEFPVCCAMRGRYNEDGKIEQQLEINSCDYCNAITTVGKDCMILERTDDKECYALRYQRNEYAKAIRKDYEAGKIQERRCNMREYTIREDGCCNTISTVIKDNYILEVEEIYNIDE